ncbi:MAG: OmpA family protein [Bacteroidota bacterium]|nr:OmpA family protein [Bacteroidota bacterium]
MKKKYIPLIVLIGMGFTATAQKKSTKEKRGDKYAFSYSFEKAIDSYNKAKTLTTEGQRKLAESYSNMNQNVESEAAYAILVTKPEGVLPEDYYNYAMILKTNSKYDEANKWMDKFNEVKPGDLRAKDYVANKGQISKISTDDGKYKIVHLDFNTEAEDFGTCYYKNKIVFSSSGANPKLGAKKYNWNGKPFLNMYVSEVENRQLKTAEIFDKSLDGKMHDGPASFSNDGTFMAFTQNNYDLKRKDRIVRVQICFSNFKDDKWSEPEFFALNSKEYSVGHPSLTSNGNTMYFTSDMPGGFGGADIYRITKDDKGVWGKAENLGDKINTEGDELFPFYEEKNGVLFFSSNGRFGLGGLDIFICATNGSKLGSVRNAGAPLNTQFDDFSAISNDQLSTGYFSSNRAGGSGDDDIYSVDYLKLDIGKKIEGLAKEKNESPIPNTFVTLFDDKGNVIDTLTTKADGAYSFLAETDKNFKLTGNKENFEEGSTTANTFAKEFVVKADVILLKKEEIIVKKIEEKIQVGADLGKILELNSIYFDLDKYDLRPDAVIELDKIVKIMNEYPDMIVELGSHTDCRASKEYNQILSDKRAKVPAWYVKKRINNPERIHGKGYGEEKLTSGCACEGEVVSTCSEEQFQSDRRTEFIIVRKTIKLDAPLMSTE